MLANKMKEYELLEAVLKKKIEAVCETDPYGLSPQTLYKNIYHSTGSYEKLSKIFEVLPSLVKAIKES